MIATPQKYENVPLIIQDVLLGFKDLCEHIFSVKTMAGDHKKAAEKMSNIKKKVRLIFFIFQSHVTIINFNFNFTCSQECKKMVNLV